MKNFNLAEIGPVAAALVQDLNGGSVVILVGEMGAGKTTLVKACAKVLGVKEEITSPTFSIIEEHTCDTDKSTIKRLIHVDTYRIEFENEIYDIGLENIFAKDAITFIEWGDRIEKMIDGDFQVWTLEENQDQSRSVTIEMKNNDG